VEDASWQTCGACGNDHATGAIAPNQFINGIVSPSEDGSSTQFSISPVVPYTDTYWFQTHNPVSGQINGSEAAPQAIEFECQQQLGGWVYNFGWQANYITHEWRIFDYGSATWQPSGVSFQTFTPGTWHHILAEYHNDVASHIVFHDALTVDGTRYPVNQRHNAFSAGSGFADKLTNAVQLDGNSRPDAYSVYVDKMRITYR